MHNFTLGDRIYIGVDEEFCGGQHGIVTDKPAQYGLPDSVKGMNVQIYDPYRQKGIVCRIHQFGDYVLLPPVGANIRYQYQSDTVTGEGTVIEDSFPLVIMREDGTKLPLDFLDIEWEELITGFSVDSTVYQPCLLLQVIKTVYAGRTTIVYYTDSKGERNIAMTRCHPQDQYDQEKGKKIAILRAFQEKSQELIDSLVAGEDI